jgi:hypothetical protein
LIRQKLNKRFHTRHLFLTTRFQNKPFFKNGELEGISFFEQTDRLPKSGKPRRPAPDTRHLAPQKNQNIRQHR